MEIDSSRHTFENFILFVNCILFLLGSEGFSSRTSLQIHDAANLLYFSRMSDALFRESSVNLKFVFDCK